MAAKTIVIERTISIELGAGALAHNRREFIPTNADPERTCENITYYEEDIQEIYHQLFDGAVDRYNDKQKRNDRKIKDYYEKIASGKQEKTFHEIVVEIGNKDDMGATTENGELAKEVLDEYMKGFQERNPTLRVFSAHLHMDEATPHLHVDFVPYISGWTGKGLDTKVSLKQALAKLGFVSEGRSNTEWPSWVQSEKEQLAKTMEKHGIRWKQLGTHREHLSVLDFKKEERAKEVAELETQKAALESENEVLKQVGDRLQSQACDLGDSLRLKYKEKAEVEEEAEKLKKKVSKLENQKHELAPMVNDIKSFADRYSDDAEAVLPEPNVMESARNYRKRIIPIFRKLVAVLRSLYRSFRELEEDYNKLKKDSDRIYTRYNNVEAWNESLRQENQMLRETARDMERVEQMFGKEQVSLAIKTSKQMEHELALQRQRSKNRGRDCL